MPCQSLFLKPKNQLLKSTVKENTVINLIIPLSQENIGGMNQYKWKIKKILQYYFEKLFIIYSVTVYNFIF